LYATKANAVGYTIHAGCAPRLLRYAAGNTPHPHGAHKHEPQRVFRVFELLIERRLRLIQPPPVGHDVQAVLLHLGNLILAWRHDERHVRCLQNPQSVEQFILLVRWEPIPPQLLLHLLALRCPMLPHLVVHLECRRLVNGHHHRLADETAPEEMPHDVPGDRLQPVVAGEDVVLPAQLAFELRLLFGVEFRRLDEAVDVLVQIRVHELQLRRAVLVKQRHRRTVLDGLLEVVDGDVIAEYFLRPFLPDDERRAGERDENRLGQRRSHVQRQRVVLAAVRLVGEDNHVRPVAEHLRRLELMDKREDVAVMAQWSLFWTV
jgi:hypothetical protein